MKKIIVVGATSSGKSTFCKNLSLRTRIPHIQLDELFWEPGWQEAPDDVFFKRIEKALKQDSWILDGNYQRTHHLS